MYVCLLLLLCVVR